jgi:hypothetical protein
MKQTLEGLPMLEGALQPKLGADYGGIAQLTAVLVAMESDETENTRYRQRYEKVGRFPGTDLRYLMVSVGATPEELLAMTGPQLACTFASRLKARLETKPKRLPRAFDYERFHADASRALDNFVSGRCTTVTST